MDWITSITRLALRRPAVVFLVTLLVIVTGVFAVFRLKTELFPDITLSVVIGGLFTSTILTLLVIPVIYSLVDDARSRLRGQPADA